MVIFTTRKVVDMPEFVDAELDADGTFEVYQVVLIEDMERPVDSVWLNREDADKRADELGWTVEPLSVKART